MIISGVTLNGLTVVDSQIIEANLLVNLDAGNPASYPGTGTTWTDLSGNNNDATMTNPVWADTDSGYFTFDGTASSYGVIADSASMSPTSITWETWVQITGAPVSNYSWVVRNGWAGAPWFFGYNTSNYWTLGINDNSTTYNQTQTSVVSAGWYQVLGTYDGAEVILYVNGAQAGTPIAFADGNITGYGSPTIINGGSTSTVPPPDEQFWTGDIAVLRMYGRALSSAEVAQNFNALRNRYGL
jgi:hypothetical protein